MEDRLAQTARIIAELQSDPAPATHTPVHVRTEAPMHTLRVKATVDATTFQVWIDWAFRTLQVVLATTGAERAGPPGALYGAEIVDDEPEEVEAFIPIAEPVALRHAQDVAVGELPERTVAVLVHAGDYDDLGDTYRTLGAWVARHADHAGDRTREWYVVNAADTADTAAWRTEVAWPVNRPPEPATPATTVTTPRSPS
jgi:effector-binding domain-containing protein